MQKCGAKTRTGETCKSWAVTGSKRCRMHGGKSPKGIASPQFKTGRYSKHVPTRLAARYLEAEDDPELIELRADVALLDARIADLLARVDTGESGQAWADVGAAFEDLRQANRKGDAAAATGAFRRLEMLIIKGSDDRAAWAEVFQLVEQRRRTVESERKHMAAMGQLVAVDKMMTLAGALLAAVKQHVDDKEALRLIAADFSRLTEGDKRD
ncbi:MAG: hypothetical protein H6641_15650 [Caldilineaceae bacterium]|nr:hypothetical protein [Caldilineaceae bacterium]